MDSWLFSPAKRRARGRASRGGHAARGSLAWHGTAAACSLLACGDARGQAWSHYGAGADRVAVRGMVDPIDVEAVAWQAATGPQGEPLAISNETGVVSDGAWGFALGTLDGAPTLIAFDALNGVALWTAMVPAPVDDSWSTPAVDLGNGSVLVAAGSGLWAFDAATGDPLWSATLPRPVVNASPVVTSDLGPRDRAFIVHADSLYATADGATLHCVNVDPFDAALNPYEPGDFVWSVPLLAAATGASPAYRDGVVYVTDAGDPFFSAPGRVRAFDATAASPPLPLWETANPAGLGFYGGVSVAEAADGLSVYAASYAFTGGQTSANLLRIDAATGSIRWSVPCNRTSSVPIPLPDGRVLLSAGIDGFGSVPSVQLFEDLGASAVRVWDTAIDSWDDADDDGVMDPGEYLVVGGWTHLPAVATTASGSVAYCGTLPTDGLFGAYQRIAALDLSRAPSDPGFVIGERIGAGNPPAIVGARLVTLGPGGPVSLGSAAPAYDVDGNGRVDVDDLYTWCLGQGDRDVDLDGSITTADRNTLERHLREGDLEIMAAVRP